MEDELQSYAGDHSSNGGFRRRTTLHLVLAVAVGLAIGLGIGLNLAPGSATSHGRPTASASPTRSAAATAPVQLRARQYRLLTGSGPMSVIISLVGTVTPGATTRSGEMRVLGHVTGLRPHRRYSLVGGTCPSTSGSRRTWASGRTDQNGEALLAGRAFPVSVTSAYWLVIEPWPRDIAYFASPPGLEGLWLTGLVSRFPAGQPGC